MTDAATLAAADLADALRDWLRARREPPPIVAAAMAYELAALIAKHATTTPQAYALVEQWTANMKDQIRRLGVGVEHP